ncbi:MAG: DUF2793 domain-containing protein [Gemmobacter sp.]
MSDDATPVLSLPLILPSQAQKHVTHNEALRLLDLLVQLVVADRDRTAPPEDPAEGDRHIVASGATGGWAGQDGAIAVHDGTGWQFVRPHPGWVAQVLAEGGAVRFDATAGWQPSGGLAETVPQLGISASADPVNRLAVASDAVLLTHAGAGHQLKVNKAAAGDTASLLFQTSWSGRAEMGLAGDDDFSVKVSPDGASFATALRVDRATGRVNLPAGAVIDGAVSGDAAQPDTEAGRYDTGAGRLLRVGAFGLGIAGSLAAGYQVSDLNDHFLSGVARVAPGAANRPVGGSFAGSVEVIPGGASGRVTQIFRSGDPAHETRSWVRSYTGSAWTGWFEDFTSRVPVYGWGADGLPSEGAGRNLNDYGQSGVYYFLQGDDPANRPEARPGILLVTVGGNGRIGQQWQSFETAAGAPHLWFRVRHSAGVWMPWQRIYHSGNVVGTVSQSGGTPTGAVVERGSNANGEYVRWADGTQICTNGNNPIATNPAPFVGTVTSVDNNKLRIGRWF